jgi:hypothetical protein
MRTFLATLMLLALISTPVLAAPGRACLTQSEAAKEYPGKPLKYRQVGSIRCWFAGRTPAKSEFKIVVRAPAPKAAYASAAQRSRNAPVAPPAADDLVGLAGTLCAGLCEDLRAIDPQVLKSAYSAEQDALLFMKRQFSLFVICTSMIAARLRLLAHRNIGTSEHWHIGTLAHRNKSVSRAS